MGLTGSIVVYVCIWWIVFFSILPVGIKSKDQRFTGNIRGEDPGAPKNFCSDIFYGNKGLC